MKRIKAGKQIMKQNRKKKVINNHNHTSKERNPISFRPLKIQFPN